MTAGTIAPGVPLPGHAPLPELLDRWQAEPPAHPVPPPRGPGHATPGAGPNGYPAPKADQHAGRVVKPSGVVRDLDQQLADALAEVKHLAAANAELRSHLNRLGAANESAIVQQNQLVEALQQARAQVVELEAARTALLYEREAQWAQAEQLRKQLLHKEDALHGAQAERSRAVAAAEDRERVNTQLAAQLRDVESKREQLLSERAAGKQAAEALRAQVVELEAGAGEGERAGELLRAEVAHLTRASAALLEQDAVLRGGLQRAVDRLAAAEAGGARAHAALEDQRNAAATRESAHGQERDQLTARLRDTENERARLALGAAAREHMAQELRRENSVLTSRVAALSEHEVALGADLQRSAAGAAQARRELAHAQQLHAAAKGLAAEEQHRRQAAEHLAQAARTDLEALKVELAGEQGRLLAPRQATVSARGQSGRDGVEGQDRLLEVEQARAAAEERAQALAAELSAVRSEWQGADRVVAALAEAKAELEACALELDLARERAHVEDVEAAKKDKRNAAALTRLKNKLAQAESDHGERAVHVTRLGNDLLALRGQLMQGDREVAAARLEANRALELARLEAARELTLAQAELAKAHVALAAATADRDRLLVADLGPDIAAPASAPTLTVLSPLDLLRQASEAAADILEDQEDDSYDDELHRRPTAVDLDGPTERLKDWLTARERHPLAEVEDVAKECGVGLGPAVARINAWVAHRLARLHKPDGDVLVEVARADDCVYVNLDIAELAA